MKFLDYPAQQKHKDQDFPYFYYHVTYMHPRYVMPYHWHPLYEIVHVTQRRKELRRQLKRNYSLYFFLLPAAALIGIFCYAPMYGILMAFQNYSPAKGILGSAWVGLKWFRIDTLPPPKCLDVPWLLW